MTAVIYKYELELEQTQIVPMPPYSVIRAVGIQADRPVLWAQVTRAGDELEERTIRIFGTGHAMVVREGYSLTYLETLHMGQFVWHVFEETKR